MIAKAVSNQSRILITNSTLHALKDNLMLSTSYSKHTNGKVLTWTLLINMVELYYILHVILDIHRLSKNQYFLRSVSFWGAFRYKWWLKLLLHSFMKRHCIQKGRPNRGSTSIKSPINNAIKATKKETLLLTIIRSNLQSVSRSFSSCSSTVNYKIGIYSANILVTINRAVVVRRLL